MQARTNLQAAVTAAMLGLVATPVAAFDSLTDQYGTITSAALMLGPTADEIQTEVLDLVQARAALVVASQPDLIGFLSGAASGAFNLEATQGKGKFDFATVGNRATWAQLRGAWSRYDQTENTHAFGVFGGHMQIGKDAVVGLMAQYDQIAQTTGAAGATGTGYLMGPYVVAKQPHQPLYLEGRYLVGRSDNAATIGDSPTENFVTDLTLAGIKVAGQLDYGDVTLIPHLAATYVKELQKAFADSYDQQIAEQSYTTTDMSFGFDTSRVMLHDTGAITLTGGLSAVWSSSRGTGFAADTVPAYAGQRARMHVGARYALNNGAVLTAGASRDGLGSGGYESSALRLGVKYSF